MRISYRCLHPCEIELVTGPYGSIQVEPGDDLVEIEYERSGNYWTVLEHNGEEYGEPRWRDLQLALEYGDLVIQ